MLESASAYEPALAVVSLVVTSGLAEPVQVLCSHGLRGTSYLLCAPE